MTSEDLPLELTDELVAAAWLAAAVPGITADMTGQQLPDPVGDDGEPASWLTTGFVAVATVGGTPDDTLPIHEPVLEVRCYAATPGSSTPPKLLAARLGSAILHATWEVPRGRGRPRSVPVVVNGVEYPSASVRSVYLTSHFRPIYGDAGDYACYQGDMAMVWKTVNDHTE